ncbi:MAG: hypothetical protein ACRDMV_24575 [Streptosporangiales bacterium]
MALDSVLFAELTTLPEVADALEARSSHDPRTAAAWRAFHLADPKAESPVETKARLGLTDAGLAVRSQVSVNVGDRVRRVDLLVERCVFLETEGATYHGSREAHARDVRRFNELTMVAEGRPMLRATYDDVFHHWPTTLAMVRRSVAMWRAGNSPR